MPAERPLVIITEPLAPEALDFLQQRTDILQATPTDPAFVSAAPHARALIVRTHTIVNAALLDQLPRLIAIGRAGVGLENIDLADAARRGIAVEHTPHANTQAVVEFVFASLFRILRPIDPLHTPLSLDAWESRRKSFTASRELASLRLGILGFGRIGSRVGTVAKALGLNVAFNDLQPIALTHDCQPCSFDDLIEHTDILSIHIDGRPDNRNIINASVLARLRTDAIIINTSRGLVIDESALAQWLIAHPRAHAILDVHATEPIPDGHPLLDVPNATLTAHEASCTAAARLRMSMVVEQVWTHLEQHAKS